MLGHRDHLGEDGLAAKRARQQLDFTWALVRDELAQRLRRSRGVAAIRDEIRAAVLAGELPATRGRRPDPGGVRPGGPDGHPNLCGPLLSPTSRQHGFVSLDLSEVNACVPDFAYGTHSRTLGMARPGFACVVTNSSRHRGTNLYIDV